MSYSSSDNEEPTITIVREPVEDEPNNEKDDEIEHADTNSPLELELPTNGATEVMEMVKVENTAPERPPKWTVEQVKASMFRTLKGGNIAVTSKGRNDGVGAQALGKITTRVMAHSIGAKYVHLPFQYLEHCDNQTPKTRYCNEWEQLLCIGGDSVSLERYPHIRHMPHNQLYRTLQNQPFESEWAYVVRDAHSYTEMFRDELNDAWRSVIEELRLRYRGVPGESFRRVNVSGTANVAVHIRRGDVLQRGVAEVAKRFLDNTYFSRVMENLAALAASVGVECMFYIISEGDESDFADLKAKFGDRIEFYLSNPSSSVINHRLGGRGNNNNNNNSIGMGRNQALLNRRLYSGAAQEKLKRVNELMAHRKGKSTTNLTNLTAQDAFKLMVGADVLVMSKSAFSYLAGLYSQGIKIFPPEMWWDMPAWCEHHDNWFRSENLDSDKSELKDAFSRFSAS